jgi:FLVCR family MFS transporter 7
MKECFTLGSLISGFLVLCLYFELDFLFLAIAISALGFLVIPVMPLSFELACELSYPVGEAVSTGMLMTGGQLVGVISVNTYFINYLII